MVLGQIIAPDAPFQPLRHNLQPSLPKLARHRTRRRLLRDRHYTSVAPEVERVLQGFEWDLELSTARECNREPLRAVAWNVERGKRFEPLMGLLTEHPELSRADLLLLTELDIGMGRSGNRNVPRELAKALGMNYVFANFHLVLAPGDSAEQDHDVPNTLAMHGAALLSKLPIKRFATVELPERTDKFRVLEKRLGSKRALLCEVELDDGPLTVVTVHLDPFASPRHRAKQMARIVQAVERFGGDRVLLGGDLNTNTYDLGSRVGFAFNIVHKLLRFGFDGTVRQYMEPEAILERRTFELLRRASYDVEPYVDPDVGSIYYDLTDPELVEKSRKYIPGPVLRWLERRLEPWGGVVPMRIDWFAGRGLSPLNPMTIERPTHGGRAVSDHNPIIVDITTP